MKPETKEGYNILYKNGEAFPVPVGVDYTYYFKKGYGTEKPQPVAPEPAKVPSLPKKGGKKNESI